MGATKERLTTLERTIDSLEGRVQEMQWELRHADRRSPAEKWWKSFLRVTPRNTFMSSCCNRRVRPNTKAVNYAGTGNQY
jgi:hypothetical protein